MCLSGVTYPSPGSFGRCTHVSVGVVLGLVAMNKKRSLAAVIERLAVIVLISLFLSMIQLLAIDMGALDDLIQLLLVSWHHDRVGVHDFEALALAMMITGQYVDLGVL